MSHYPEIGSPRGLPPRATTRGAKGASTRGRSPSRQPAAGRAGSGDGGRSVHPTRRISRWVLVSLALLGAIVLTGALAWRRTSHPDAGTGAGTDAAPASAPLPAPERLVPRVLAVHPHDTAAYTQGLLWHDGALYESVGLYGRSGLRRVDLATGKVLQKVDLDPRIFGEGLALVPRGRGGKLGDRLVQLTWQEGRALLWDRESFRPLGERRYEGEGWGLCLDGDRLLMSDGSDRLSVRDPETFAATGEIRVTREGVPVDRLNELECAEGAVWANVYLTDEIVRIDPASGRVTAVVDASRLLDPVERARAEVLNGIAYDPARRRYLLTGKNWPKLFEVELAPAPGSGAGGS